MYACTCSPAPRVQRYFSHYSGSPTPPSLLHCSEDQIVNHFSRRNGSSLLQQYIPPRGSSSSLSGSLQGNAAVCSREAAQMLFCPMLCLTFPALTNPGSEGQTDTRKAQQIISAVLEVYIFYLIKVMIKL